MDTQLLATYFLIYLHTREHSFRISDPGLAFFLNKNKDNFFSIKLFTFLALRCNPKQTSNFTCGYNTNSHFIRNQEPKCLNSCCCSCSQIFKKYLQVPLNLQSPLKTFECVQTTHFFFVFRYVVVPGWGGVGGGVCVGGGSGCPMLPK